MDQIMFNHFPYPKMRSIQRSVIDDLLNFIDSDKRLLMLELPTGVGKSALGYTIASHYRTLNVRSVFLTKTKVLQDQYSSEFNEIIPIKGRSNYKTEDEYEIQLDKFNNSIMGITNYHNFPFIFSNGILIIDEAHEFLNHLSDRLHYSFRIDKNSKPIQRIVDFIKDKNSFRLSSIIKNLRYSMFSRKDDKIDYGLISLYKISSRILEINPDCRVMVKSNDKKVEIFINGIDSVMRSILEDHKKVIMMSATYGNIDFYLKMLLGDFNKDDLMIRSIQESPFNPENRPIKFMKIHSLGSNDKINRIKTLISEVVDPIISNEWTESKNGLIHSVSYENAELIKRYSRFSDKIFIVRNHQELDQLLKMRGIIIVSPSLEEGVGFNGDKAEYQILLKAPIEPVFGVNKFMVRLHGRAYLNWKAAIRVVQSYGRIIRTEECSGTTYIVDKNFSRISGSKSRRFYPKYFFDSFKVCNKVG